MLTIVVIIRTVFVLIRAILLTISLLCFSIFALAGEAGESQAYQWSTALTVEAIDNFQGGVAQGTRGLANLDATLAVDTEAAGWWGNGTWFVYMLGDYGKNPSELSGDLQTLSNIATDDALKVYEFWYQHAFVNDSIKLLFGLHDYNSTFYSLDSAGYPPLVSGQIPRKLAPQYFQPQRPLYI
jgi:porin